MCYVTQETGYFSVSHRESVRCKCGDPRELSHTPTHVARKKTAGLSFSSDHVASSEKRKMPSGEICTACGRLKAAVLPSYKNEYPRNPPIWARLNEYDSLAQDIVAALKCRVPFQQSHRPYQRGKATISRIVRTPDR
jgi:hypothetical protein